MRFDDAAQDLFKSWRADLERLVRSGDEHPAIEAHLPKYRSLIPALALLIHLADGGPGAAGKRALDKAISWERYLEPHARRIFSSMANIDYRAAKALARKISSRELRDGFSLRDVYRPGWSGLMQGNLPKVPHRRRVVVRRSRSIGRIVESWTLRGRDARINDIRCLERFQDHPNGKSR